PPTNSLTHTYLQITYQPLPNSTSAHFPLRLPLRLRPNSFPESCSESPSAKRILRLVSRRQSFPASMRSMVDSETPALRASSAFAISCSSRNRWTLFTRPDLPIASSRWIHGPTGRRQGTARIDGSLTGHFGVTSPAVGRHRGAHARSWG